MDAHVSRIGLTGGIGSGKSTVAQMLVARGAYLIDADAIARSVTLPHGAAIDPIAKAFGADFITPDGALNRDRMRQHIFSNPQAKQQLEAIVHPLVSQQAHVLTQQALQAGARAIVFDVPLLVESGRWRSQVNAVWVVDCAVETQIQRVMQRSALSREAVQGIIANQASRAQRLAAADAVIVNDGIDLPTLQQRVNDLPL